MILVGMRHRPVHYKNINSQNQDDNKKTANSSFTISHRRSLIHESHLQRAVHPNIYLLLSAHPSISPETLGLDSSIQHPINAKTPYETPAKRSVSNDIGKDGEWRYFGFSLNQKSSFIFIFFNHSRLFSLETRK